MAEDLTKKSHVHRIPFYHEFKFVFVLWMALPYTNGALWIWQQAEPILETHAKKFEAILRPVSIILPKTLCSAIFSSSSGLLTTKARQHPKSTHAKINMPSSRNE